MLKRLIPFVLILMLILCFARGAFASAETVYLVPGMQEIGANETGVHKYTSDWRYWSQGASIYSPMRKWGCRIVAQSKLLAEAGLASMDTSVFNPDMYFDWVTAKGNFSATSCWEYTTGGLSVCQWANESGVEVITQEFSLAGMKRSEQEAYIMNLINTGHYVIVNYPEDGDMSTHQAYVGRAASIDYGRPVLLDSFGVNSQSPYQCRTFVSLRDASSVYAYLINDAAATSPGLPTLLTNKSVYIAGETVTITLGTVAGSNSQYLQFLQNQTENYLYNGSTTGTFRYYIKVDQPGEYTLLYQTANKWGSSPVASKTITVLAELPVPVVTTDMDEYRVGDTVTVSLGNVYGSISQYMQFQNLDTGEYLYNQSTTGVFCHQIKLTQPGRYQIAYQTAADSAQSPVVYKQIMVTENTTAPGMPVISTGRQMFVVGETVTITLGNRAGSTTQYLQFQKLDSGEYLYNKDSTGVYQHTFTMNQPGRYGISYQTANQYGSSPVAYQGIEVIERIQTPSISTDKDSYSAGETVHIMLGNAEASDQQYMQFKNMDTGEYLHNQSTTGQFAYAITVDEPGTYKILYQIACQLGQSTVSEKTIVVTENVKPDVMVNLSVSDTAVCRVGDNVYVEASVSSDDTADLSLMWSSSDPSVAAISEQGIMTMVGMGEAVITASAKVNPECSASFRVLVIEGNAVVALPEEMTLIAEEAFFGNTEIKMVILPEGGSLHIAQNAFAGCDKLVTVYAGNNQVSFEDGSMPDTEWCMICHLNSAAYQYAVSNDIDYLLMN